MKKNLIICLPVLLAVLIFNAFSVDATEVTTNSELSDYIEEEFEKMRIPGMSVEIVDANNVLFAETYGNCTSLDAPFIIGSISKSFTAAAVMQLAEQGKIDLSDPIAVYLPKVSKDSKTTVRQLLNQTSGINTYNTLENYQTSDTPAAYQYANTNYALLGQIVENVSGMAYSSYVQAHIFEPLGMERSFTSLEAAQAHGLVAGYRNYFGLMVEESVGYPANNHTGWITVPAGYILSSTNDMGRYLQMYLNNGENVLTPGSVDTMMYDSVDVAEDYQYGMGFGLDYRSGELMLVHGGNVENYTTYMILMPQRGIAAIVMFNACDFFVANEMAIQLSYNIVNNYLSLETDDIGASAYLTSHALIDAILFFVLLLSLLPLILLKRWRAKNKGKIKKSSVISTVLLHAVLPTFILLIFPIVGLPLSVVQGFAPDVFVIVLVSSAILLFTGVIKLISFYQTNQTKNSRI